MATDSTSRDRSGLSIDAAGCCQVVVTLDLPLRKDDWEPDWQAGYPIEARAPAHWWRKLNEIPCVTLGTKQRESLQGSPVSASSFKTTIAARKASPASASSTLMHRLGGRGYR
jgi:hypothetical protein